MRHYNHRLTELEDHARRTAEYAEALRRSFPDATDEDITDWVWGDAEPPTVLRSTRRFWDTPPETPDLSPLAS